jgi:hypothetical protein
MEWGHVSRLTELVRHPEYHISAGALSALMVFVAKDGLNFAEMYGIFTTVGQLLGICTNSILRASPVMFRFCKRKHSPAML